MNPRFLLLILCSIALLASCASRFPELQTGGPNRVIAMDNPLTKFDQDLTTPQKELTFKPEETIYVPVTIRNLTGTALASAGRYPINLSYKWFDRGKILPIEGERTSLVRPLEPNEQETIIAKVTAPRSGSDLTLRFTLVQERVAWFFEMGAPTLDISARLER